MEATASETVNKRPKLKLSDENIIITMKGKSFTFLETYN